MSARGGEREVRGGALVATTGADAALIADAIGPHQADADELDYSIDPRIDLDGHVNARWRAATALPRDRSCWDTFSIVAERTLQAQAAIASEAAARANSGSPAERVLGAAWRAGNDLAAREHAGLDEVADELAAIDALRTVDDVVAWLDADHARGGELLHALDVTPDFLSPDTPLLYVDAPRLPLDRADYLTDTDTDIARRRRRLCRAHCAGLLRRAGIATVA
ncbi:MAG: hypothetical protein ACREO8_10510, partial [Luteimonas sp.]